MLFLVQDGITNGAIYALLGLALVLVFAVTRVILIPQGRVRHLWRADLCLAVGRPGAGHGAAGGGDGRGGVWPRSVRRPAIAACAAGRAGLRDQHRAALHHFRADILARRPSCPDRDQHRAVAGDRRGDRTVSLSHRVSADRPYLGAGAADRGGRLPSGFAGLRPGVFRRRRPARTADFERRLHRRPAALHRPEHRRLCHHGRLHRRAVAVLRLYALWQGAARHRRQPAGRAAGRHPNHAVGTDSHS